MQKSKGKPFPKEELFKTYTYHPLHFNDKVIESNLSEFDQEYVFYMIYNGQPTIRSEDIDHIHPRSLLMVAGFDEGLINNIVNYQLLDSGTNRGEKNGKKLAEWIDGSIEAANKQGYLNRHFIPQDQTLWETEQFESFLEARAKMLAAKINTLL